MLKNPWKNSIGWLMSKPLFSDDAWEDYLYWQSQDKKTLKRINALLRDIARNGNEGIGKPEPLREDLSGYWSRQIDYKNRLVYRILDDGVIKIHACRSHYGDK
jgi:toxin YoeB